MTRIGELFAGYGGLGAGVQQVYGGDVAWVSDIDPGANKILAHRFPDVPNLGDITTVDWSQVEPVDVLCGGFPCQDVSAAGKRAGIRPGTRSGLWAHFAYAIAQLRPRTVVIENVRGLLSARAHSDVEPCAWCVGDDTDGALRALGAVLGDLAGLGYDASWHGVRAADVGAPHGRFRVFVVATDTPVQRRREGWTQPAGVVGGPDASERGGEHLTLLPTPAVNDMGAGKTPEAWDLGSVAATQRWGDYAAAIARWEHTLGRPAPAPTMTSKKGTPQLSPLFVEWMMGLPAGWVTDVPGITRNEALKALGNGVVPQQAAAALAEMATWAVAS